MVMVLPNTRIKLPFLLALAVIFAAAYAGFGPNPQAVDPTPAIARGFFGVVTDVSDDSVTVEVKGVPVIVSVTPITTFKPPVTPGAALTELFSPLPTNVTVLAVAPPTGGQAEAQILTVIPQKATRKHIRAVVAEKPTDEAIKVINAMGETTELSAKNVTGVQKGDSLFVLVRPSVKNDGMDRLIAARDTQAVTRRILRLAQTAASQSGDPSKSAPLFRLLEQHQNAERNRLQQIPGGSPQDLAEAIEETMKALRGGPIDISELLEKAERSKVVEWAERSPIEPVSEQSESHSISSPMSSICAIRDDIPPTVRITSPPAESVVLWGTTITISAEAEDDQEVIDRIGFVVNVVDLGAYTPAQAQRGFDYLVPDGSGALNIEATARDACGNTATATRRVGVLQFSPPTVEIISPVQGAELIAGRTLTIVAKVDTEYQIVSVEAVVPAGEEQSSWLLQPPSSALPDMDWRVVAKVPSNVKSLTIDVTATDNLGQTATASVTLVIVNPGPTVEIVSPAQGATVLEGSIIDVKVRRSGNVVPGTEEISWPFVGELGFPKSSDAEFTYYQTRVPDGPATTAEPPSYVPPHILRGTATVNNSPAADGTPVTVFVEVTRTSPLTLEATATGVNGETATHSVQLEAVHLRAAGESAIINGKYQVQVVQPKSQNFTGKTIRIFLGGQDTGETATWSLGEIQLVNLATTP